MNAIRYFSKTGHTEKMAQVVSKVSGVKAETVSVPLEEEVDVLFLGSSVYYAGVSKAVKDFIASLTPTKVKKVVCFSSAGVIESSYAQVKSLVEKQGVVVDPREFHCRGELFGMHKGHPNEADLAALEAFVMEVLNK